MNVLHYCPVKVDKLHVKLLKYSQLHGLLK